MVIILLGIFYRADGAKPKFVQVPGPEMNNIAAVNGLSWTRQPAGDSRPYRSVAQWRLNRF